MWCVINMTEPEFRCTRKFTVLSALLFKTVLRFQPSQDLSIQSFMIERGGDKILGVINSTEFLFRTALFETLHLQITKASQN